MMKVEWLDSLPDMRVPGVPGVPPQKTVGFAGTPSFSRGVPGVPEHQSEHLGTRNGTPIEERKALKNKEEHKEHQEHPKMKHGPVFLLEEWERGVASLDPDRPLGGYDPDHWRRIVRDCDNLIADFGRGAAAMGWSTIDLFGFDPAGGIVAGLVRRLDGGRIVAMDDSCATYRWPFSDRTSRFARGYLENCLAQQFVPVWELGV
ncbi:hypothetical protein K7W03_02250 [Sphingobium sp. PNB]|uniref:hypothetical protein n=1 Tax=Sphingobium sp. PNB TaxID=863934 RepID=UPI001CA3AC8B|nr:hypothetical protein [Sphingobium sp. PNB]MCB4858411.1 hypothetical protein [Sphingobium sp. PNB]